MSLIPDGGRALITVPNRFPYHPDPIDTGYRPTTKEISSLFPDMTTINESMLRCGRLWDLALANPSRLLRAKASDSAAGNTERKLGHWLPYTVRSFRMSCVEMVHGRTSC
jgi:hypothetical protein